jgi:hypothetical protein
MAVVTILCDGSADNEDDADKIAKAGLKRSPFAWRLDEAAKTAVATSRNVAMAKIELDAERTAVACHTTEDDDGNPWLISELGLYHVLLGDLPSSSQPGRS